MKRLRAVTWVGLVFLTGTTQLCKAQAPDPSRLTLDRIINENDFNTEGFGPARWLQDGSAYTTLENGDGGRNLVKYDPATGAKDVLVSSKELVPPGKEQPLSLDDYVWSKDGSSLLIFTNTRRVWRLNTRGDYYAFNLKTRALTKIDEKAPEATLMFAKFSPDGQKVGYVRENNIYVQNLADGAITALTSNGTTSLINGTFDWVYEEEFSIRDGFRWNPDSSSIAYWQLDTSGMKDYVLVNTTENLYPTLTQIRYPKVGQTNPACRVGVVPVTGGETQWMAVPGDLRDNYIPRMDWVDKDTLGIQHLNRLQNTLELMLANPKTGAVSVSMTDVDPTWVEVVEDLHWIKGGQEFTWISETDDWRHLYLVPRAGGEPYLVTPEPYDVIDVLRVNEEQDQVDFLASPTDPTCKYLYRTSIENAGPAERLTPADQTGTHGYQISPDGRWAFHTYSAFDKPPVIELISLPDHKVVRTFTNNAAVADKLAALQPTPTEFFRVDIGNGVELDGWCIKPPDFDPTKKYPLLVHVYGEPAGQTVLNQWGGRNALWHRMLAQKGYLVVSIDNRGTPAPRGRAWRKSIYRQIGILASQDQAAALRALEKQWQFIDADRVGIWGWSGGGSMSLNAIFRHPDLYKTAIAIAFISDQTLYDTIYQERYMGLPSDNADGYRNGSPITFADGLKGNLLIIHGTGDDNCHFQSCERLINALVALNKPFSMMAYPNRSHGIFEGPGTSRHLYETMTRYLETNLPAGPR